MSKPGECERASVKLVGRRGNNNVERGKLPSYMPQKRCLFLSGAEVSR